jgi:hypothetical protein
MKPHVDSRYDDAVSLIRLIIGPSRRKTDRAGIIRSLISAVIFLVLISASCHFPYHVDLQALLKIISVLQGQP